VVEPVPATPAEETVQNVLELIPPQTKKDVYRNLAAVINHHANSKYGPLLERINSKGKTDYKVRPVVGEEVAKDILVLVFTQLIQLVTRLNEAGVPEERSEGLPAGLGSLALLTAGATTKMTPQGAKVDIPERWRFRYSPGKGPSDILDTLVNPVEARQKTADWKAANPVPTAEAATEAPAVEAVTTPA
jgi:hypothetical protein